MDYIQGLAEQTEIFLYALGFGFLLGILYGIFRIMRTLIPHSKAVIFLSDLIYFAVCTFLIFCFILITDSGNLRGYVMFGVSLGWAVCYFSFGAILAKICNLLSDLIRSVFSSFLRHFTQLVQPILKKVRKNRNFAKKMQ